jgi:hypothetical protein
MMEHGGEMMKIDGKMRKKKCKMRKMKGKWAKNDENWRKMMKFDAKTPHKSPKIPQKTALDVSENHGADASTSHLGAAISRGFLKKLRVMEGGIGPRGMADIAMGVENGRSVFRSFMFIGM